MRELDRIVSFLPSLVVHQLRADNFLTKPPSQGYERGDAGEPEQGGKGNDEEASVEQSDSILQVNAVPAEPPKEELAGVSEFYVPGWGHAVDPVTSTRYWYRPGSELGTRSTWVRPEADSGVEHSRGFQDEKEGSTKPGNASEEVELQMPTTASTKAVADSGGETIDSRHEATSSDSNGTLGKNAGILGVDKSTLVRVAGGRVRSGRAMATAKLHQTEVFGFLLRNEKRSSSNGYADFSNTFDTVCLFADISGFTALSEVMSQQFGVGGAAGLKKHLNQYFGLMVKIVMKHGGDVIKFAGDAMIVLWPPAAESMVTRARRAVQCSMEIQTKLHRMKLYVAAPHDLRTGDRADAGNFLDGQASPSVKLPAGYQDNSNGNKSSHKLYLGTNNPGKQIRNIELSVKIGIGMGQTTVMHLGGKYGRMEFVVCGSSLAQAFQAEHHAEPGNVILHQEVWNAVEEYFEPISSLDDGCVIMFQADKTPGSKDFPVETTQKEGSDIEPKQLGQAAMQGSNVKPRGTTTARNRLRAKNLVAFYGPLSLTETDAGVLIRKMKNYVPAAVLNWLGPNEMIWSDELRHVSILFVNLGFDAESELANMHQLKNRRLMQEVVYATQEVVYHYEGSLNKVLMDDKGSTLIAVFGLPPMAHEQDATRALLASLGLCAKLYQMGKTASIGVTTGVAFCGVVGGNTRREYSVLGDVVNLSARLMQRAQKEGGGVLCDAATKYRVRGGLVFARFGTIKVKGKKVPVKVFRPYPENLGCWGDGSDSRKLKSGWVAKLRSSDTLLSTSTDPEYLESNVSLDSTGDFLVTKTNSYGNRQKRVFRIVAPIQVLRTFDVAGNIKKELELRTIACLSQDAGARNDKQIINMKYKRQLNRSVCIKFLGGQKDYHCEFLDKSERERFCNIVVQIADDPRHSTALRGSLEDDGGIQRSLVKGLPPAVNRQMQSLASVWMREYRRKDESLQEGSKLKCDQLLPLVGASRSGSREFEPSTNNTHEGSSNTSEPSSDRSSTRAIMGAIHSVQISAYMEVQRRHLMRAITVGDIPGHNLNFDGIDDEIFHLRVSRLAFFEDILRACYSDFKDSEPSQAGILLKNKVGYNGNEHRKSTSQQLNRIVRRSSAGNISKSHLFALQENAMISSEKSILRKKSISIVYSSDEDEPMAKDDNVSPSLLLSSKKSGLKDDRSQPSGIDRVPAPVISFLQAIDHEEKQKLRRKKALTICLGGRKHCIIIDTIKENVEYLPELKALCYERAKNQGFLPQNTKSADQLTFKFCRISSQGSESPDMKSDGIKNAVKDRSMSEYSHVGQKMESQNHSRSIRSRTDATLFYKKDNQKSSNKTRDFWQSNDIYSMDVPVYLPDDYAPISLEVLESLVLGSNHVLNYTAAGIPFLLELEPAMLKLQQSSLSMVLEHVVRMKLDVSSFQARQLNESAKQTFNSERLKGKQYSNISLHEEAVRFKPVKRCGPQTLVIEADIGMGKSHAISVVASRLHPARVVVAAGNPFAGTENDFAWAEIVRQMIDVEMKAVFTRSQLRQESEEHKLEKSERLKHVYLTNEMLDNECRSAIVLAAVREDKLFSENNTTSDGATTALKMMYNGPAWLRDAVKFDNSDFKISPEALLPLLNNLLGTNFEETVESKIYNVSRRNIDSMVENYVNHGRIHCLETSSGVKDATSAVTSHSQYILDFASIVSEFSNENMLERRKLVDKYRKLLEGCALQCERWKVQLVLMVTNSICRLWPHAILVDDIMYLDEKSW